MRGMCYIPISPNQTIQQQHGQPSGMSKFLGFLDTF
jgi:hypothetical protein